MGDVIPFLIDSGRQLSMQTEALVDDAAKLQRDTAHAIQAAEALLGDVISVDFTFVEPDYDNPA